MSEISLTDEQKAAITTLDGSLFVAAGAGSGKTGVVTRRFVHAICSGRAEVDQILTITFTKKAAAEMMNRVRDLLREQWVVSGSADQEQSRRMAEAYRQIEKAQISTIDSFCSSVLRAHVLAAGIDPEFRTLDESQAQIVMEEAFDTCLLGFVEEHKERATHLISAYDANLEGALFNTISETFDILRSQGHEPVLPLPDSKLAGAEKQLREAIKQARAAVQALDNPSPTQLDSLVQTAMLEEALDRPDDAERFRRIAEQELKGLGRISEEFTRLKEARDRVVVELRSLHARGTLELMGDLLERFARQYEADKRRLGVLDFNDLSLRTRSLLQNERVRNSVASRYRLIMVDEFQDTNGLQLDILRLISRNNLCLVGDENQSIYRFRHAVVELFQEQMREAEKGGYLIRLDVNYRSQPGILAFVDHIFDRDEMLRPGYHKLTAAAGPDGPDEDRRVEICLVDERRKCAGEGLEKVPKDVARKAEARLIAERLDDLRKKNGYKVGDMALLVRTARRVDTYRDALSGVGIESYLAVGRSYFEKLELGDVVNVFRLIINPLDDIAMFAALRSPIADLSDDSLYWLRQAAIDGNGRAQPVWTAIREAGSRIEGLFPEEQKKLDRFSRDLKRLRTRSRRMSLADVSRQVIEFNDYAAATAARPSGKRKLANLMKLLDMAADFERSWGNELAEFTNFLESRKKVKAKEAEAPTAEEGVKAVRILTMHGAKGLEFPLVVLPDLGQKGGGGREAPVILLERHAERVGLRFKSNSVYDGNAFEYETLKEERRLADLREEKRLGYVAMTRARRHLILSGKAPADRLPSQKQSDPPLDWLRNRLQLCWERDESFGKIECLKDINGTDVGVHLCVEPEALAERYDYATAEAPGKELKGVSSEIFSMSPGAQYVPAAISPTAIDTYAACPRRYYLERELHAGEFLSAGSSGRPRVKKGQLGAQHLGSLVHALLEHIDWPLSAPPADEFLDEIASRVLPAGIGLAPEDRQASLALMMNLKKTEVFTELQLAAGSGNLKRELSFSTILGQDRHETILKGKIDAFVERESGALVVDYKTGKREDGHKALEIAEGYKYQTAAYGLAASRLKPGPVDVVLVFLEDPVEEVRITFGLRQADELEKMLAGQLAEMREGVFGPLPAFDPHACNLCPANQSATPLCPTAAGAR